MTKRAKITIKHGTDAKGRPIVFVPLRDGKECILYEQDLDSLLGLGLSPMWYYHSLAGVCCYLKKWKRYGPVARVLLDAGPHTTIKFIDGNKINLRSDNLVLTTKDYGEAKLRYRDGIEATGNWTDKIVHTSI